MEKTVEIVKPRPLLRSVLRQQVVFEGGGDTGSFSSSRANIERDRSVFLNWGWGPGYGSDIKNIKSFLFQATLLERGGE